MRARLLVYAAITAAVLGGFSLVADALVVSDEEAVSALVEDFSTDAATGVLEWTEPESEPVDLQVEGRVRTYDDGAALADALSAALGDLEGSVEVVQQSVNIQGDRADVAVRARQDGQVHQTRFRLVRDGERWLVTRIVAG